jgi:hypothetical protein
LGIREGVELDDTAHFSTILGGDTGGVDTHRLDVVCADVGTKAGRTIVSERNAVDDELGLVFLASRMEDGVAFVEPARLRIHQIL